MRQVPKNMGIPENSKKAFRIIQSIAENVANFFLVMETVPEKMIGKASFCYI